MRRRICFLAQLCLLLGPVDYVVAQTKEIATPVTLRNTTPCTCTLATSVSLLQDATSCVSNDGRISVTVSGGSGDYSYTWSDQSGTVVGTTSNMQNLRPGYYSLSVKDNSQQACTGQGYFEIKSDMVITFVSTPSASCVSPSGTLSAVVTGGSGDFAYEWTLPNGSKISQPSLLGLKGGQYILTVTDRLLNCSVSKSTSVKNPANLTLATAVSANTSCGSPNGSAAVTVSGGSGDYQYYWFDMTKNVYVSYQTTMNQAGAGSYSLYVVDQLSGCTAYEIYEVAETTSAPQLEFALTPNSKCGAPYDGSITMTISGGGGPYTYSWSDGQSIISTQKDPSSLPPGSYAISVTDQSTGCEVTYGFRDGETLTIEDLSLPAVTVSLDQVNDVSVCSSPNGSIEVSVASTTDYTYYWTGPNGFSSTSMDLANLAAGTYVFHVEASCNGTNHPPVILPDALTLPTNISAEINLLEIISDPDNNLDLASITLADPPSSGVNWWIDDQYILRIQYSGTDFIGKDQVTIRACDLMGMCTERVMNLTVSDGIVIFNAVAPHSSGDNKFMRILNLPQTENTVSIFNRWGDKVFEVKNYDSFVPGKRFEGLQNSGGELPSGTYFYKIEFADGRQELTGYLALKQ